MCLKITDSRIPVNNSQKLNFWAKQIIRINARICCCLLINFKIPVMQKKTVEQGILFLRINLFALLINRLYGYKVIVKILLNIFCNLLRYCVYFRQQIRTMIKAKKRSVKQRLCTKSLFIQMIKNIDRVCQPFLDCNF